MNKYFLALIFTLLTSFIFGQQDTLNRSLELINAPECAPTPAIRKFRITLDAAAAAPVYSYKVVVGREITYKYKPAEEEMNWVWELGAGTGASFVPKWNVSTTDGSIDFKAKSDNNRKAIINISELPTTNEDFGDTYGTIRVTNNQNQDGTFTTKPANKKVKVFFEKDANNPHGNTPNWFYYWSKSAIVQDQLIIEPGIALYDVDNCEFNDFLTPWEINVVYSPNISTGSGLTLFGSSSDISNSASQLNSIMCEGVEEQSVIREFIPDFSRIDLTDACGFSNSNTNAPTTLEGFHLFYSTFMHEREHMKIGVEVWSYTDGEVPPGYSSIYDKDDDGYKDIWEDNLDNPMYPFVVANINIPDFQDDSYQNDYDCYFDPNVNCNVGTLYEEDRCRAVEANIIFDESINLYDWSFDPTNIIQGKNWKKN